MKVNDISVRGKRIIELGHYDADEITRRINELVDRFNGLKDPLESRLSALEESLKWFQLAFDADVEMQWIQEKKLIAESKEIGQTLADASNLLKKHDQLSMEVASHQVQIEALLSQEGELLRPRHPAAVALREKLQLLNDAWSNLSSSMNARKNLLKWGLQKEQYLFDLSEVEEWINERNNQLVILNDDKLDQLNAPKLMASVRTIVADMLVYKATLKKLTNNCKELSAANERYTDNAEMLMSRQEKVETDLAFLEESANKKASTIDGFIKLFELDDEARNFLDWIAVQIQITQSEEYGQDYEHLLVYTKNTRFIYLFIKFYRFFRLSSRSSPSSRTTSQSDAIV
jgi:spectrin beta